MSVKLAFRESTKTNETKEACFGFFFLPFLLVVKKVFSYVVEQHNKIRKAVNCVCDAA